MVARSLKSELVYLLEEDVWIARDYFFFHRAAHDRDHMAVGGMPSTVRNLPRISLTSQHALESIRKVGNLLCFVSVGVHAVLPVVKPDHVPSTSAATVGCRESLSSRGIQHSS